MAIENAHTNIKPERTPNSKYKGLRLIKLAGAEGFLHRCFDEGREERMGFIRLGIKFWVILHTNHKGVVFDLHDFNQVCFGINPTYQ